MLSKLQRITKYEQLRSLQLVPKKTVAQWAELCTLAKELNIEPCLTCSVVRYILIHPTILLHIKSQKFALDFQALKHITERHLFRSVHSNASKFPPGTTLTSLIELITECALVLDQYGRQIKYPNKKAYTKKFYVQLDDITYCLIVGKQNSKQQVKTFYPVRGFIKNEVNIRIVSKVDI